MKKTYLLKHKRFLSAEYLSCGVYAVLFALFACLVRILFPNFFWEVVTPIFRVSDTITADSRAFLSGFDNTQALATQNEQLIQRNTALANENQILTQKLDDISALACQHCSSPLYAGVIARPPESPYDTFVLAAGKSNGVTEGMEVFGANSVPLGVISSVSENFSRAILFSSPGIVTNGWVGSKKLPITLFGAGSGAIDATMPRSAGIAIGDIIFVSGPGALPIGTVGSVDSNPSSPSVTLRIIPAANLFSTTWVLLRDVGALVPMSATSTIL